MFMMVFILSTIRLKLDPLQSRTVQFDYTISNQADVNMKECRDTLLKVLSITKHSV